MGINIFRRISLKKKLLFWFDVTLTIFVELCLSYIIYSLLVRQGYMYTFRVPISTEYLSFTFILLFMAAIFTACTIGIFKEKDNGEVQSLPVYFLSYVKHPIPLGSIILFLFTFFFM